jgi:hypothetical protein
LPKKSKQKNQTAEAGQFVQMLHRTRLLLARWTNIPDAQMLDYQRIMNLIHIQKLF